ncbi:MAG: GNAT family N-acetyltransferase [Clostridia bacterium]|nr:GNAT family N-acetyltransferase [Clostridia bacterium]
MQLQNNEVSIRLFCEADIPKKVEWINDPKNNRYLHYDIPLSCEATRAWFFHKDDRTRLDCVIEYEGVPVGLIGLLNIDTKSQKAEYYISMGDTSVKRRGIATRATFLLLRHAFETLGLNKVYLNVDDENEAACRLYEKVGFVLEGRFIQDLWHRGRLIDRRRYAAFRGRIVFNEGFESSQREL